MMKTSILFLVAGCVATETPPAQRPAAQQSDAQRPDESGPPAPLRVDVITSICRSAQCSGKIARVHVHRDPRGQIARYVHEGDITSCSHPPWTVYDGAGKEVGLVGMQPVTIGSPEQKAIDARWSALLAGAKRAETTDCSGQVVKE